MENEGRLLELIHRVAPRREDVADWVRGLKRANPQASKADLAALACSSVARTYAAQSAGTAMPSAIPGLGTVVGIGLAVTGTGADLALMLRNQAYMVYAVAECWEEGRSSKLVQQDLLLCVGLWSGAITLSKAGVARVGTKVVEHHFKKNFPAEAFKAINKAVGTTVLTKYGVKRGGLAIGKLIPFGVGAAVCGGVGYVTMRGFGAKTQTYFQQRAA